MKTNTKNILLIISLILTTISYDFNMKNDFTQMKALSSSFGGLNCDSSTSNIRSDNIKATIQKVDKPKNTLRPLPQNFVQKSLFADFYAFAGLYSPNRNRMMQVKDNGEIIVDVTYTIRAAIFEIRKVTHDRYAIRSHQYGDRYLCRDRSNGRIYFRHFTNNGECLVHLIHTAGMKALIRVDNNNVTGYDDYSTYEIRYYDNSSAIQVLDFAHYYHETAIYSVQNKSILACHDNGSMYFGHDYDVWKSFRAERQFNGRYRIKAIEHDKYVGIDNNGYLNCNSRNAGDNEEFILIPIDNNRFRLSRGNFFLTPSGGSTNINDSSILEFRKSENYPMVPNHIIPIDSYYFTIGILSVFKNRFVACNDHGNIIIEYQEKNVFAWEQMEVKKIEDGRYFIRSRAFGRYLGIGDDGVLSCNFFDLNEMTKFELRNVAAGYFNMFANGKYFSSDANTKFTNDNAVPETVFRLQYSNFNGLDKPNINDLYYEAVGIYCSERKVFLRHTNNESLDFVNPFPINDDQKFEVYRHANNKIMIKSKKNGRFLQINVPGRSAFDNNNENDGANQMIFIRISDSEFQLENGGGVFRCGGLNGGNFTHDRNDPHTKFKFKHFDYAESLEKININDYYNSAGLYSSRTGLFLSAEDNKSISFHSFRVFENEQFEISRFNDFITLRSRKFNRFIGVNNGRLDSSFDGITNETKFKVIHVMFNRFRLQINNSYLSINSNQGYLTNKVDDSTVFEIRTHSAHKLAFDKFPVNTQMNVYGIVSTRTRKTLTCENNGNIRDHPDVFTWEQMQIS